MDTNQIKIQEKIEEVMGKEFEQLLIEYSTDPLLKLIIEGKITLPLNRIKKILEEE